MYITDHDRRLALRTRESSNSRPGVRRDDVAIQMDAPLPPPYGSDMIGPPPPVYHKDDREDTLLSPELHNGTQAASHH